VLAVPHDRATWELVRNLFGEITKVNGRALTKKTLTNYIDPDSDADFDSDSTLDDSAFLRSNRTRRDVKKERENTRPKAGLSDAVKNMLRDAAKSEAQVDVFNPSFKGKRFEEDWLRESLGGFYFDHLIADILGQVKGGKEANVYRCSAHPQLGVPLLAAKVYRPRMFRNLKNDADYRSGGALIGDDGKALLKQREQRAVAKRSKVGLEMLHNSWLGTENAVLRKLTEAGASTPKVYAVSGNAILMDYFGDQNMAAPPLSQVSLDERKARRAFDQVVHNIRLMLENEIVHGDLSAFNILYWGEDILLIDFPQASDPWKNPHAKRFFERDVARVCEYFAQYGIAPPPERLARDLWFQAFNTHGELKQ
jgi:RIO kinase 1